jgi:predicted acetyltransferase
MAREVRRISAPEIGDWCEQMGVGFHYRPAKGWAEYLLEEIDIDRTWGGFDDGAVVGTLRSLATALTVPGGQVTAAALTNVTVAPTHTRQGILTEMITSHLTQAVQLEEPVGILIASEWPIYGRFGYGAAVESAKYEIDSRAMRFRDPATGSVEIVDDATIHKLGPSMYEKYRLVQPGAIERIPRWWDRHLHQGEIPGDENDGSRNALYRSPSGEPEGYVRYKPNQDWDAMVPKGKMTVHELLATTPDAYRALWSYCCRVDLMVTIEAGTRAVDEPLAFLVNDGRAVKQTARYDFVWVRVLDVPKALASRTYSASGRVVIEVADDLGHATGTYALDGGPDGATCERTDEEPDLALDIGALGSVYLGGMSAAVLGEAGLVHARDAAALRKADAMFTTPRKPWCATWF